MSSFCRSVASLLFFCYKKPFQTVRRSETKVQKYDGTRRLSGDGARRRSERARRKNDSATVRRGEATERRNDRARRRSDDTILLFFCYGLTTPNAAPIEIHVNCLIPWADFTPFRQYPHIVSHIMTKPDLSFFKNRFDICLVTRQILSYSP